MPWPKGQQDCILGQGGQNRFMGRAAKRVWFVVLPRTGVLLEPEPRSMPLPTLGIAPWPVASAPTMFSAMRLALEPTRRMPAPPRANGRLRSPPTVIPSLQSPPAYAPPASTHCHSPGPHRQCPDPAQSGGLRRWRRSCRSACCTARLRTGRAISRFSGAQPSTTRRANRFSGARRTRAKAPRFSGAPP